jgi:hypothetical protein
VYAVNVLGGAFGNVISNGVMGGTIAGGGSKHLFSSEAAPNIVLDNFGTIGGGLNNTAGSVDFDFDSASAATVGGGENNRASGNRSFVGGGLTNSAGSTNSAVAGGANNGISDSTSFFAGSTAVAFASGSCIGGGENNSIATHYDTFLNFPTTLYHSFQSVIGGGLNNSIYGANYATVPGGRDNLVAGNYGLAAGHRAKANHTGAFVWADSTDADFASTSNDQFLIRASGGVGIGTGSPARSWMSPVPAIPRFASADPLGVVRV